MPVKVWVNTTMHYLSKEKLRELYLEAYERVRHDEELRKAFIRDVDFDGENIDVDEKSKAADAVLEACKKFRLVPIIEEFDF